MATALVGLALCVSAVGLSLASFTDTTQNPQTITAAADWTAPSASARAIAKSQGGIDGYVKEGGTYYVYASVTDSGNPASGIASVKANVSALTTGQTAVSLVAGSYTVDGVTYNYRNASALTAKSSLSAGSKSYSLALADSAGNSASQSFTVTVDNGPFKGSSFATDNGGSTEGKPEAGDTVSFGFNDAPDPNSIVSDWNGSGTKSVTVSITNNSEDDALVVSGATIGSVALKGDFTSSTATFSGSSLSLSGSTVTIVLGTASGSIKTDTGKSKAAWTPSASNYDAAGNAAATTAVNGSNQKQF